MCPSVGPSVGLSVGNAFGSAGRDEPGNDLFRVYELVIKIWNCAELLENASDMKKALKIVQLAEYLTSKPVDIQISSSEMNSSLYDLVAELKCFSCKNYFHP